MLSSLVQAQSDRWLPITGADTLREKVSGLKVERMLKGGEISRGEYFADGTGVVHEYGASFARTWEIRGDDQLCIAVAKVALCYTFEQNADDPTLYRVKDVDTGKITEFNVIDGKGVVKGDVKEVDARGSAATPSAAEIAAELANPNTPMATLTFKVQQRSFEGTLPDADNQDSTTLLLQPSLPFPLENGDSILFRPAIPLLIDQPVFNAADNGFDEESGMGDIAFDLAYARTTDSGIITAGGIISSLPTATDDSLGSDRFTLGPEFMIGKLTSKYVLGIFPNHQWDVGGSGDADINLTTIQFFGTWLPGTGWSFGTAPVVTYDHNADQWTVPINLNAGKTVVWNGRPWKLGAELNYYTEKAETFGPEWMLGFSIGPVVKNGMAEWFK